MSGLNIRELRVTHHGFHPLEYLLRTVSVKICLAYLVVSQARGASKMWSGGRLRNAFLFYAD